LNIKDDIYEAEFSNLGIKGISLKPDYVSDYDRLLCGGIWCIVQLEYEFIEEISPNSILVSGGQTTVANLFYNMSNKSVGLVGLWDCVAFDEVAGITFKDKDGVQIMKDYMASGSFARGKEEKSATASMVFVGNINQSVDVMIKTAHLFEPFPEVMAYDTAFLDRMHCYIPGWEIPKFRPEHFTNDYGFITDFLARLNSNSN